MAKRGKKKINAIQKVQNPAHPTNGQVVRRVEMKTSRTAIHQGPLPPPEMLQAYDLVVPGLAERIMAQWEKQTDHRIFLEKTVISGDNNRANWGLASAFAITILVIVVCGLLALYDKIQAIYAIAAIFVQVAVIVGTFIYGTNSRKRERESKMAQQK